MAIKSEKRFKQVNGSTGYTSMMLGTGKGGMHITRRTYLIVWLQIIQEWVGVAGVTVYAPVMFRNAGLWSTLGERRRAGTDVEL